VVVDKLGDPEKNSLGTLSIADRAFEVFSMLAGSVDSSVGVSVVCDCMALDVD
jgi:hypothetical protein